MALLVLLLGALAATFFRTQVIQNNAYLLRSDDNRLRVVSIPAPRGAIYDRNGELIAETVPEYSLLLDPAAPDVMEARLAEIAPRLDLDSARLAGLRERIREGSEEPVLVSRLLTFEQVSWVEENRVSLSGLRLEIRPERRYPGGPAIAHVVGYVGEISQAEMQSSRWADYRRGQEIGKAGLEREYERRLSGTSGARFIEVDVRGRSVGQLAEGATRAPVAGEDLHLTLDLSLQRYARSIFPKDKRGAIVAMVPRTGEILALYSHPTFDPNLLAGQISPGTWRQLNEDPNRPLLNRATFGIYPPGSTWKLATAIIALEKGVITPRTKMPTPCTGGMTYAGRYARCGKPSGHGAVDLAGAIANSCNVYFYQLGIRLGLHQLAREGARLGFGRRTGVDLPSEQKGTFPEDLDWYREHFGRKPTPSDVMSLAIGQGPNAQTPLRIAQFFAALAGDGTAPVPHVVVRDENAARQPETDLRVSRRTLASVREGLARVLEPGGSAHHVALRRWKLSGKTGTSQNSQDPKRPHAWFAGFAGRPGDEPEIVIAVVVEFGESGGAAAAPLAARVADFYLTRKHRTRTRVLQTRNADQGSEVVRDPI